MDWCNHETIIIYNPNLWNHEKPPINFASTDRPKPLLKSLPQQGCPPLCTWRIQKNDHFICRKGVGLVTWSCLIYKSSMFGMLIQIYPNQSKSTRFYQHVQIHPISRHDMTWPLGKHSDSFRCGTHKASSQCALRVHPDKLKPFCSDQWRPGFASRLNLI